MSENGQSSGTLDRLAVHQAALDRPGTSNDVAAGDYGFAYDGNGNIVQVVNVSDYGCGNFHWQAVRTMAVYEYDAYGNVIGPDTNADGQFDELDSPGHYAGENAMRFSTKYFDRETGLGYWGYRYYSPGLGRWISRDPLGELGGLNLYGYCSGRPMFFYDPLGLLEWYEGWPDTLDALFGSAGTSDLGGGIGYTLGHGLSVTGERLKGTHEGLQAGMDSLVAAAAHEVGYLDDDQAHEMSPLSQAVCAAESVAMDLQEAGGMADASAASVLVGATVNQWGEDISELGDGLASGDPMAYSELSYDVFVVTGSMAASGAVTKVGGQMLRGPRFPANPAAMRRVYPHAVEVKPGVFQIGKRLRVAFSKGHPPTRGTRLGLVDWLKSKLRLGRHFGPHWDVTMLKKGATNWGRPRHTFRISWLGWVGGLNLGKGFLPGEPLPQQLLDCIRFDLGWHLPPPWKPY